MINTDTPKERAALEERLSTILGFPVVVDKIANLISIHRPARVLEKICEVPEQELLAAIEGPLDFLARKVEPVELCPELNVKTIRREDCSVSKKHDTIVYTVECEPGDAVEYWHLTEWRPLAGENSRFEIPLSTFSSGRHFMREADSEFNALINSIHGEGVQILAYTYSGHDSWVRRWESGSKYVDNARVWADLAIFRIKPSG